MRGFSILRPFWVWAVLLAAPAAACPPPAYYPPPMLPGESDEAYRTRIEQQAGAANDALRARAEAAQFAREDELWRVAEQIVVAEVVNVSRVRRDREGRSFQRLTLRHLATERGRGAPKRFRLTSDASGSMCFAPQGPEYPTSWVLVLFARKGKLSDATVIDWTATLRTTHPDTLALLVHGIAVRALESVD